MGLWPTQGDENRESSASLHPTLLFMHATALRFVIPTGAERRDLRCAPDFPRT
jgi:hypothetical protein